MKKIHYIISTFLFIDNFLNATGANIQQKTFKETANNIYKEQMNILESKQCAYQMNKLYYDNIKVINKDQLDPEEKSIVDSINKKYEIMLNLAKIQDMITNYKYTRKQPSIIKSICNINIFFDLLDKKYEISSMQELMDQIFNFKKKLYYKLENDVETKIYIMDSFINSQKNSIKRQIIPAIISIITLVIALLLTILAIFAPQQIKININHLPNVNQELDTDQIINIDQQSNADQKLNIES